MALNQGAVTGMGISLGLDLGGAILSAVDGVARDMAAGRSVRGCSPDLLLQLTRMLRDSHRTRLAAQADAARARHELAATRQTLDAIVDDLRRTRGRRAA